MLRSTILLGVAALAVAQDSSSITSSASFTSQSSASTSAASTSSGPVTHTIAVAKGGHTFVPDITQTEAGDVIEFQFYPTNHSVVRAEYGYPCIPYEDTGVNKMGFFSGFKPVDAILPDPPTYFLTINDTSPIFFYCGAPGSCLNYQMVGVINPNASTSLVTQKQKAKDSTFMLLPGEPWPAEDASPFTTIAPSSTATSTPTSSAAAAAATTSAASTHHSSTLSPGAIAGIAIGAAAIALGAAIALFLCGRHSRAQRQSMMPQHQQNMPFNPHGSVGHMSYAPSMNKHMSMHSSNYGPPLPGYQPSYNGRDSAMTSPGLNPHYSQSEALNPGMSEATSPAHSPGVGVAVPAYTQNPGHMSMQSNSTHPSIFSAAPPSNVHEMAAPLAATGIHQISQPTSPTTSGQGAGIMGFIRKSSISKAGGVERYG